MNDILKNGRETQWNIILALISSVSSAMSHRAMSSKNILTGCFVTVLTFSFSLVNISVAANDMEGIREEIERKASEPFYLDMRPFLYGRSGRIVNSEYPKQILVDLLKHPDPKTRTLAAIGLFEREDPGVLPAIATLIGDDSLTFSTSGGEYSANGVGAPQPQTVGQIAVRMLGFYMNRAHDVFRSSNHGFWTKKIQEDYPQYWKVRTGRDYCVSWFAVHLARACQVTSPITFERNANIRKVRERIDQLPVEDRAWTLLALRRETGADSLVSEYELLEFCRQIGPDKLIRVLQRDMPSADPDLQPGNELWGYFVNIHSFILQHAGALLRPEDVPTLIECERQERDFQQKQGNTDPNLLVSAWWAVARASLMNQSNAVKELRNAYDYFQGEYNLYNRKLLSLTLLKLGGESGIQVLKDWFYSEKPVKGGLGGGFGSEGLPYSRAPFIFHVPQKERSMQLKMIAAIIEDDRFESLDVTTLVQIFLVVHRNGEHQTTSVKESQQCQEYLEEFKREHQRYSQDPAFRESKLKLWQQRLRQFFQKQFEQDEP